MRQPRGASELIRARLMGKRPDSDIVITDLPEIAKLNRAFGQFVLTAGPGEWDMRCVHGLPVIVWCWTDDLLGLVESVMQAEPSHFGLMPRSANLKLIEEMNQWA
jgi:hypothetical protein